MSELLTPQHQKDDEQFNTGHELAIEANKAFDREQKIQKKRAERLEEVGYAAVRAGTRMDSMNDPKYHELLLEGLDASEEHNELIDKAAEHLPERDPKETH